MQRLYSRENIRRMQCYFTMIHCFLCVNVCFLFSSVAVAGGAMEALEFLDVVRQYCFVYLCTSFKLLGLFNIFDMFTKHRTYLYILDQNHIHISWPKMYQTLNL
jgi:hypothetical protein